MYENFEAQLAMFPSMVYPAILDIFEQYKYQVREWKFSGSGGSGYLVLVWEKPVKNALKVRSVRS
jgi:hypothetical protein